MQLCGEIADSDPGTNWFSISNCSCRIPPSAFDWRNVILEEYEASSACVLDGGIKRLAEG